MQAARRGTCLVPFPSGGGLGWGQVQNNYRHRACPHPSLPPEGEGAKKLHF